MRTFRRGAFLAAGVAALTVVVSGCTTAVAAPPGVEGDGAIILYGGRSENLVGPLIEQFTADTGIDVVIRYGSSTELNALLLEEGEQTPADVFLSQDAGALGSLSKAGLVDKIPSDLASLIPAGFTSENDDWIGVTGRARVIAYDGGTLAEGEVPTTVDELTAEKWEGKVAFAPGNASMQSFITAYRVLKGEEAAEQWVKAMSENSPIITENNNAALDLVQAGQADLALINHYYWYRAEAELGTDGMRAQLKFLPGDPGGIVNVTGAAILDGSSSDPDVIEFVEYLVSEKGQNYFVENTYEYPLRPGVEAPEGLPTLESLVNPDLDLSDLEALAATQELLAKYGLL